MRICVVGAGVSGLPSIKACVEEGLDVVCFEKSSEIGGLWNFRPDQKDIGGTVMESTVVNTSKEMMAYSDFPPDAEWANFMHHSKVNEYIKRYADHFDLRRYIRFNTTVKMITKELDVWNVELCSGETEKFDKVMLCTGHHSEPLYPQLRDMDRFKGRVMHAHEYINPKGFENKNVFLLGIGNSALDIAVDIAKIAKSVTISTRRGTWIFNRVSDGGMPYDTKLMTRYYDWIMDTIPWTVANDYMEHRLQQRMDHDIYGLRPNHRFFQQHPTVNDALANLICSGYITITEDVDSFTADSVIVKGGRSFACDIFVSCTGYTFGFPFIQKGIFNFEKHEVPLYKYVFAPSEPSVAVIGLIQPIGSVAPISEIQTRWAVRTFNGKSPLPSIKEMKDDIELKRTTMRRRYFESEKHTIQVDYLKYMDEIAKLMGCMPDIKKIFLRDPRFGLRLFMGANVPYVYRLVGPHSWPGAEEAIRTAPERVKKPLKNRQCRTSRHKKRGTIDEYFRYSSMKWIAHWFVLLLVCGLIFFCSGPTGISPWAYCMYCIIFFTIYSFLLLWFDLQYSMSTVL